MTGFGVAMCNYCLNGHYIQLQAHLLYAVKTQTSLALLSRFCGSHVTTAHAHQCCRFQSYAKTVPSRLKLTSKIDKAWTTFLGSTTTDHVITACDVWLYKQHLHHEQKTSLIKLQKTHIHKHKEKEKEDYRYINRTHFLFISFKCSTLGSCLPFKYFTTPDHR